MACCGRYCVAETQFSEKIAYRDLQRYERRGPDGITRTLLKELRNWPLRGKELLDIGGGIGVLGGELADSGLAGLTLVEASPAYLVAARSQLERRFSPRPANFLLGDLTLIADSVACADIVTLDRVICCYPDAEALLSTAVARTRQLLAFTYPRDRWYVRMIFALQNMMRWIKGNAFRTFVHSPKEMTSLLERAGFLRQARRGTLVWVADLYHRGPLPEPVKDGSTC